MTYKPTVLNIATGIFLIGIFIFTVINYKTLSADEGWGVIAMFGLIAVGLVAGLADLILQRFIKDRKALNLIGIIITIGLAIAILKGK